MGLKYKTWKTLFKVLCLYIYSVYKLDKQDKADCNLQNQNNSFVVI